MKVIWKFCEPFLNFLTLFSKEKLKKRPCSCPPCVCVCVCVMMRRMICIKLLYTLNRKNAASETYLLYFFRQIFQTLTGLPAQHLQCYEITVITDEQNNALLKRTNHKDTNYLQMIKTNLNLGYCQRISDWTSTTLQYYQ